MKPRANKPKAFRMRPLVHVNRVETNNYGWSEPSADTLKIAPIRCLVEKYMAGSNLSIDPFARNCAVAHITNDMNPDTLAQYHMPALDFLLMLKNQGDSPDLVIFDPPYSMYQCKEHYEMFGGGKFTKQHASNVGHWSAEKRIINDIIAPNGIVIHMGWHSNAMPRKLGWETVEILLVAHGRAHHDTIVTVAQKKHTQMRLI